MVAPEQVELKLFEPGLKEDASSNITENILPGYNAFSADGNVTAELVFVNYGIPKDYEELKRIGIDVKGKIVIAKYGGSWRGIKPKVAYENGAIGCICIQIQKMMDTLLVMYIPQAPIEGNMAFKVDQLWICRCTLGMC